MSFRRKCFAVILALVMVLPMAGTVSAEKNDDTADYVRQILNYYTHHQEAAGTDIDCLIYELSEIDLELAQAWASIMEYWTYVNSDFQLHPGVLPDGLPKDDSLCIVVLGYELASDGTMKKELIGRLETALKSAEKYPNAYIACTGGGTADYNNTVTEAGEMAKWLMEKGIAKDRIIVEDQSFSTVDNARYTCRILSNSYPQVTHLALVTSDYHLPRASLLFHTEANLSAVENDVPLLCIAANAAFEAGRNIKESFEGQINNMLYLTGISISEMEKPALSKLDCILVSGNAQCLSGMELNLQVTAYYDTGLYRDVTNRAKYIGIDLAAIGEQTVTVAYEEGGKTATAAVKIEMLPPETEPPTEPPTAPATEAPATEHVPEVEEEAEPANRWLLVPLTLIAVLVVAEILIIIRLIKLSRLQKAAKQAAKEEEDAKLPDDDSPLEYV